MKNTFFNSDKIISFDLVFYYVVVVDGVPKKHFIYDESLWLTKIEDTEIAVTKAEYLKEGIELTDGEQPDELRRRA